MTWLERLTNRMVVRSIFQWIPLGGTVNDNQYEFLKNYNIPPKDDGTVNDLFFNQRPITREELIVILEARIRKRLS